MEFGLRKEEIAFREEVRTFLRRELSPQIAIEQQNGRPGKAWNAFLKKLGATGWLGLGWPVEYGGGEGSLLHRFILADELTYHEAPYDSMAFGIVGPSLLIYGTEDQKKDFLPRMVRAEIEFAVAYSEPGSGSDMASLQTKAIAQGDDYLISGQKIFTTKGHYSDYVWLLVRTDPNVPKHKGLSIIIVDLKSPGIDVRPLINAADHHSFNEIYMDYVRIPRQNLVGEENRGWYQIVTSLDLERSPVYLPVSPCRRLLDDLLTFVREFPLHGQLRRAVAELAVEVEIAYVLAYRALYLMEQGLVPDFQASMVKLYYPELLQRISQVGMRVAGLHGLLRDSSRAPLESRLSKAYLIAVSESIQAGTSEIQRNIIAQRGLGLPRG